MFEEWCTMVMIEVSSLFQPALDIQRPHLCRARVQHYMNHPDRIRGVEVFENPVDGERLLVSGHHRTEAATLLSWTQIDATLMPGTRATQYWDLGENRRCWFELEPEAGPPVSGCARTVCPATRAT
jgi:hypothetical protein